MNYYLIAILHTQLMEYIKVKTGVKHGSICIGYTHVYYKSLGVGIRSFRMSVIGK